MVIPNIVTKFKNVGLFVKSLTECCLLKPACKIYYGIFVSMYFMVIDPDMSI